MGSSEQTLIVGLYILVTLNIALGVTALVLSYKSQSAWEALINAIRAARRR